MVQDCDWADKPDIHERSQRFEGFHTGRRGARMHRISWRLLQAMGVDRGQVVAVGKPGKSGQVGQVSASLRWMVVKSESRVENGGLSH